MCFADRHSDLCFAVYWLLTCVLHIDILTCALQHFDLCFTDWSRLWENPRRDQGCSGGLAGGEHPKEKTLNCICCTADELYLLHSNLIVFVALQLNIESPWMPWSSEASVGSIISHLNYLNGSSASKKYLSSAWFPPNVYPAWMTALEEAVKTLKCSRIMSVEWIIQGLPRTIKLKLDITHIQIMLHSLGVLGHHHVLQFWLSLTLLPSATLKLTWIRNEYLVSELLWGMFWKIPTLHRSGGTGTGDSHTNRINYWSCEASLYQWPTH